MAKLFELRDTTNNMKVSETIADNAKEAKEYWSYIINDTSSHINLKVTEIGRYVGTRAIRYSDLAIVTIAEAKSIPAAMLRSLINKDFSNDNQTFFMLERGLVNNDRSGLSDKGGNILKAWLK